MCSVALLTTTRNMGSKITWTLLCITAQTCCLAVVPPHPKMNPQKTEKKPTTTTTTTQSHFILINTLEEQKESETANVLHPEKCNSGTFRCFNELPFKTQASCVRGLFFLL